MRVLWLGVSLCGLWVAVAFAAGDLEGVATYVRDGDEQRALQGIAELPTRERNSDSVRYLEGRLLLEVGRPCDAMDRLAEAPSSLPEPLRADALRRWAIAAARCGHCADARPVLLGLREGAEAPSRHSRVIAADCAVQLGELEVAAEELERLTRRRRVGGDEVTLCIMLYDVYSRLGRPEDAQAAALRGWVSAVQPGQRQAAAKLEESASPSVDDQIDRAESFVKVRRFGEAVQQLEAIPPSERQQVEERWVHVYGKCVVSDAHALRGCGQGATKVRLLRRQA